MPRLSLSQPQTMGEKENELKVTGGSVKPGLSDTSSGPVSLSWAHPVSRAVVHSDTLL